MNQRMYQNISVKTAGENCFSVTIVNSYTQERESLNVCTNSAGEGLWINGKQVLGTCQFLSSKNPREAVRRFFQKY